MRRDMAIADASYFWAVAALVVGLSAPSGAGAGGATEFTRDRVHPTEFTQPPGGWLALPEHDVRVAVYYINLNRSTARRQAIEASLEAAGVPARRLEAIALREGDDVDEVLQRREVTRGWCCRGESCEATKGGPVPWSSVMPRKELRGVRPLEGPWKAHCPPSARTVATPSMAPLPRELPSRR